MRVSTKYTYNWQKRKNGVLGGADRVVAKVHVGPTCYNGTHRLLWLLALGFLGCRHGKW
jgi:hypothetical protein